MIIKTASFTARELVLSDADYLQNIFLDVCRNKTQSVLNQHTVCHKTKLDTYGLNLSKYLYKTKLNQPDKIVYVEEKDLFSPIGLFEYPYSESINKFLKNNIEKRRILPRFSYILGLENPINNNLFGLAGFTSKIYQMPLSQFHRSGYFVYFISPLFQGRGIISDCKSVFMDLLYGHFFENSDRYIYLFSSFHPLNNESMAIQNKFNGTNMFPSFAKTDRIDYYFEKESVYKSKGMHNPIDFALTDYEMDIKRINGCIIKSR